MRKVRQREGKRKYGQNIREAFEVADDKPNGRMLISQRDIPRPVGAAIDGAPRGAMLTTQMLTTPMMQKPGTYAQNSLDRRNVQHLKTRQLGWIARQLRVEAGETLLEGRWRLKPVRG